MKLSPTVLAGAALGAALPYAALVIAIFLS